MGLKIIKISDKKPPQWILKAVKKQFDVNWENRTIFTYGDLISNCVGEMTEDLLIHESNHTKQQKECGGSKKWWKRYLKDEIFRYEQELECYQKQYQWVKQNIKDRNLSFSLLRHYATCLSGKMYGNIVGFNEALQKIMNK